MQYHISPVLINPAAAGFDDSHNLHLNLRAQWTGFPDAPKTYTAYYNGPIGKSFGLGVGLLSETAAQLTRLKAQLNFAFKFNIQETAKLSAGFFTEFQQMTVDNAITGGNSLTRQMISLRKSLMEKASLMQHWAYAVPLKKTPISGLPLIILSEADSMILQEPLRPETEVFLVIIPLI